MVILDIVLRNPELELEEKDFETKISKEEIKKPTLTKERIVYWLQSFKNRDIKDIDYQRTVIDTLVNSVYLYDNDDKGRKIIIAYSVSHNQTRTIKCSDIDSLARPNKETA